MAYFASLRAKPSEPSDEAMDDSDSIDEMCESGPLDVQQAFHRFHFVYALINARSQAYIGYSHDVWHRVSQHNRDKGAKATRGRGPWYPFSILCFAARVDAEAKESYIHSNFEEFAQQNETSLREVIAQIGVAFDLSKIQLVR